MDPDTRRRLGAYYTPAHVADWIVARVGAHGTVWDPGVGQGSFLLAVLRATPPDQRRIVASTQLFGYDVDPDAVAVCRQRLTEAAGLDHVERARLARNVVVRDTLRAPPQEHFDVALGNPPFLNRLRNLTALDPELARALRHRHGAAIGPYTDTAAIFLLEMLRAASRVGLVLPASTFAARDAAGARRAASVAHAWCLPAFPGVGVPCVALTLGSGGTTRWAGETPLALDRVEADGASWASLLYHESEPPTFTVDGSATLGDVADATADFRDEYYALKGRVREDDGARDTVRLVTSGSIDLGSVGWGTRNATLHGAHFQRPVAPVAALHPRQLRQRTAKLLVATQTAIMEGFCDPEGAYVGVTPVLAVYPTAATLPEVAVAVLSPVASAWALRTYRGSALSLDTIKLSASQLLSLPLPRSSLAEAARLFEAGAAPEVWGAAVTRAYGAPDTVTEWWSKRLNPRRPGRAAAT